MALLNIVLVEPRIPQNAGNVARTCAATGAALHLVGPMGFVPDDVKLKRAGLDYWHFLNVTHYSDLADFLKKTKGADYFFYSTKARKTYSGASYPDNAFLLFGREDAGLPESLLYQYPESCLRIPMIGAARSLNLSNSVAIAVYEVLRQWDFPELESQGRLREYDWKNHDWKDS